MYAVKILKMKSSITRRKFIKLSGFAAVSVGSGFTVSKLFSGYNKSQYSIYGFLPSDDKQISEFVNVFYKRVRCYSEPIIKADKNYFGFLARLYHDGRKDFNEMNGTVTLSINKIFTEVNSDIIVSDDRNPIYSVNVDMDVDLRSIRRKIKGTRADVFISAVYHQNGIFSSPMKSSRKEIVIYTEQGLLDRIPINTSYKNIIAKGPQGKTEIAIDNGLVSVVKSTCRHKLCEKARYGSNTNDVIACAPNRVIIKIEKS